MGVGRVRTHCGRGNQIAIGRPRPAQVVHDATGKPRSHCVTLPSDTYTNMAAANPSTLSGGIPQPFHIILAGAHDAGKTTFFNTLVTEFKDSFKFKSDDKRSSRQGVQFESCHHKYLEDSKEVKVREIFYLIAIDLRPFYMPPN